MALLDGEVYVLCQWSHKSLSMIPQIIGTKWFLLLRKFMCFIGRINHQTYVVPFSVNRSAGIIDNHTQVFFLVKKLRWSVKFIWFLIEYKRIPVVFIGVKFGIYCHIVIQIHHWTLFIKRVENVWTIQCSNTTRSILQYDAASVSCWTFIRFLDESSRPFYEIFFLF